mmetsp:Transcript_37568/g.117711  ORF Transcript_37568/g.117711 Transcript_37568/m.117711 type:complete len:227 (-) Transcript_37568:567-1247(-)
MMIQVSGSVMRVSLIGKKCGKSSRTESGRLIFACSPARRPSSSSTTSRTGAISRDTHSDVSPTLRTTHSDASPTSRTTSSPSGIGGVGGVGGGGGGGTPSGIGGGDSEAACGGNRLGDEAKQTTLPHFDGRSAGRGQANLFPSVGESLLASTHTRRSCGIPFGMVPEKLFPSRRSSSRRSAAIDGGMEPEMPRPGPPSWPRKSSSLRARASPRVEGSVPLSSAILA